MDEFKTRLTAKDAIYNQTKFVCQLAELQQIGKSDDFYVFSIQRAKTTILCYVSNIGNVKLKCIEW